MSEDKKYFDLTSQNALTQGFETPPAQRELGGSEPDIATNKIRIYIGTSPVAFDLKQLYEKGKKEIPAAVEIFRSYNAYILSHTVGIIKEGGWESVQQLGYRMKFKPADKVFVLDIMPQAKYIKTIGGEISFAANLDLKAGLSVPDEITELVTEVLGVGVGGKVKVSTGNSFFCQFSFSVVTPEIQAVGKHNSYSEWVFDKARDPLYGRDIEMFQVILVNRFKEELEYEASVYSTIGNTWMASRRDSPWIPVTCKLKV